MRNDLTRAVRQLAAERGLPEDVVMNALEAALIAAYRKTPEAWAQNVRIGVEPRTGEIRVFAQLAVVEEVQDKRTQVSVEEARKINPKAEVGDVVEVDVTPKDFGRIAAQTAKQVILQRIREAEREATFFTYADRKGEIVQGTVQSIGPEGITINLDKVEAILPRANQIPSERYARNQRIRVYVEDVKKTPRGPEIVVSRTHKDMLRRLMEVEVPEIFNGTVEIKAIAREAGSRSKVAVAARQEGVDPVGACVGIRGVRIQALVNELSGEKIDIVAWSPDPAVFIANALSPAQVTNVRLIENENGRTAEVVVPDNQLSLAIGKEGQNARLAAKLTNWRIDIKSESEAAQEAIRRIQEEARRAYEQKALEEAKALLAEAEAAEAQEAEAEEPEPTEESMAAVDAVAEVETSPEETVAETPETPAEVAEPTPPVAEEPVAPEKDETPEPEVAVAAEEPESEEELDWEKLIVEKEPAKEEEVEAAAKPKRKKKPRQLEYDEKLGEVVARQRRKPGRRQERWDRDLDLWDEEDDWDALDDWDEDLEEEEDYKAYLDYDEDEEA